MSIGEGRYWMTASSMALHALVLERGAAQHRDWISQAMSARTHGRR
jgi:hypothetical protein